MIKPAKLIMYERAYPRQGMDYSPLVAVALSIKRLFTLYGHLPLIKWTIQPCVIYTYIFVHLKSHEAALWCAIREIILSIPGCQFHWSQAIWHKVQDLGLAVAYMEDAKT